MIAEMVQHGVASATVAARLRLEIVVYMGLMISSVSLLMCIG